MAVYPQLATNIELEGKINVRCSEYKHYFDIIKDVRLAVLCDCKLKCESFSPRLQYNLYGVIIYNLNAEGKDTRVVTYRRK